MSTSMVMEMNLGEKGRAKQSGNGGGGGRRKTKGSELNQKKPRIPQRGMGVEQLERVIELQERRNKFELQERRNKLTEVPSLHPYSLPSFNSSVAFTTSCNTVSNAGVQFRPAQAPNPAPAMFFHGIGIHGANMFSTDHVMDPSMIGSSNVGFRFENSKELSSIPNYVKCDSDSCGFCHKKKRINATGSNACSANQFRNFCGNNTVAEMMDAAKARRCSGQVTEVMSVHRSGGSSLTEYEFFPGKGGRADDYKEFMRIGTTTWCGSGTSVGGSIGLRGGDGSCVTATTGNEEGSISSVDLSLKL